MGLEAGARDRPRLWLQPHGSSLSLKSVLRAAVRAFRPARLFYWQVDLGMGIPEIHPGARAGQRQISRRYDILVLRIGLNEFFCALGGSHRLISGQDSGGALSLSFAARASNAIACLGVSASPAPLVP